MRHRIIGNVKIGLGTSAPELIPNKRSGSQLRDRTIKRCSKEAFKLFFEKFGYCDAGMDGQEVRIGIEPAYEFDPLKIIILSPRIEDCALITGRAVESWAAKVISTRRNYSDYKYQSKFVRFVDKWHPQIFAGAAR